MSDRHATHPFTQRNVCHDVTRLSRLERRAEKRKISVHAFCRRPECNGRCSPPNENDRTENLSTPWAVWPASLCVW